jgi:arylsulfatase A-like enzyme
MPGRHVIVLSVDDLRFDAVPWQLDQRYWTALGIAPRLNMPSLTGLAAESVCFSRCVSAAGYTPLAHATAFTGCYARRPGVVNFHNTTCRADVPTLSERFARAGFRTLLLTQPGRQALLCDANRQERELVEHLAALGYVEV